MMNLIYASQKQASWFAGKWSSTEITRGFRVNVERLRTKYVHTGTAEFSYMFSPRWPGEGNLAASTPATASAWGSITHRLLLNATCRIRGEITCQTNKQTNKDDQEFHLRDLNKRKRYVWIENPIKNVQDSFHIRILGKKISVQPMFEILFWKCTSSGVINKWKSLYDPVTFFTSQTSNCRIIRWLLSVSEAALWGSSKNLYDGVEVELGYW